jgi:hypothetical protein
MKRFSIQLLAITFIACLQPAGGQDSRPAMRIASDRNQERFLQHIKPLLKATGKAGRLYYHAECWTKEGGDILFPQLNLDAPSQSKTSIAALREALKRENEAVVTEGGRGIIRISIRDGGDELLKTKIHLLKLNSYERYNDHEAIVAICQAREVQDKMRALGIEQAPAIFSGRLLLPEPELPHLPASMKAVTMDEALDRVAQTFHGLVIYGECTNAGGRRLFILDFSYIGK